MPVNQEAYKIIKKELDEKKVSLVAVSKTKSVEEIMELYHLGQRDFGENYVQELVSKAAQLPKDIRWHFIGHLQRNKVKFIAPFVHLIHGVDRYDLLQRITIEARSNGRVIDCLLQVHIAEEETKFGFNEEELRFSFGTSSKQEKTLSLYSEVRILGLMGMASFTENEDKVRTEFKRLKRLFDEFATLGLPFTTLSMGMSGDYKIAVEEGSTMVRIGSLLFGEREKNT